MPSGTDADLDIIIERTLPKNVDRIGRPSSGRAAQCEVIGKQAGVRVTSVPIATSKQFSFLSRIVGVDNPASSALTRQRLGWTPSGSGLLVDLDRPDYFA